MIRRMVLAALVAALVTTPARAGDVPAVPFDDGAFLTAAATGGLYDARLCDLVGSQTRNAGVRKFAACVLAGRMVGSNELKAVAKDAGVELPTKLDDMHQKQYETFKEYKGADLERDFVKAMTQRLAIGVAMFTRASKEAKDPAVREFAAKTLPALQKHWEMAKNLDK